MPDNRLQDIKAQIWSHRRIRRNLVDLQVYSDKSGITLPITEVHYAEKLLKSLTKKIKHKTETPKLCIIRYEAAHKAWFKNEYPNAFKDGHYLEPSWPDVGTSNGLTNFIVQYLTWIGFRATRISVEGRVLQDGTRIKSSTRKGTADISSTIRGKSVQFEVKVGRDKPSPSQLREQSLERKAGGEYFFTHSVEEFFNQYDGLHL